MNPWIGGLDEGDYKEYKIITCMKPPMGSKSLSYMRDAEFYFGKFIDISVCIRCEARVSLFERAIKIKNSSGEESEMVIANSKLDPDARMRCQWFRQWATENMSDILTLRSQERSRLNQWLEGGKRRAEWLEKNIESYLLYNNTGEYECPFCVNKVSGIIGDSDSYSYGVSFGSWERLASHINETHGLIRIIKFGRRGISRWKVKFNGDETYGEIKPVVIGEECLEKYIENIDDSVNNVTRKSRRDIDDLLGLLD